MTIVITGSSGFLGKALISFLLKKNFKLILLQHEGSTSGNDHGVQIIKYSSSLIEANIIDDLKKNFVDAFIHLAWKGTGSGERNNTTQFSYNVSLTLQSVLLAFSIGCKQWIGSGSQAEYGIKNHIISEADETNPITEYGKAKLFAGINALNLAQQLNIAGTWNRIFSLYGPGEDKSYFMPYIINSFKSSVIPDLTACEQEWDYLYVDDAASAIYSQLISKSQGVFNLCSGETINLRKVVDIIQKNFPGKTSVNFGALPYSPHQIMHLHGNCNKLKSSCMWTPMTTIENGIIQSINYYLNNDSI